jgi:hypothetical protein
MLRKKIRVDISGLCLFTRHLLVRKTALLLLITDVAHSHL